VPTAQKGLCYISEIDILQKGGENMRTEHDRKRIRKQTRKKKIRYLRQRIARATDSAEREQLIEKLRRISPEAPVPEAEN
jgi:truncated hemoglobin YjbI